MRGSVDYIKSLFLWQDNKLALADDQLPDREREVEGVARGARKVLSQQIKYATRLQLQQRQREAAMNEWASRSSSYYVGLLFYIAK